MKNIFIAFILLSSFAFANTDDKSKSKIVGYTDGNIPITEADREWRNTVRATKNDWGKVVTMPENCKSGLENKLYDIAAISTNVLNKDPREWLTGKYLEFVNSQCSLSGTYSLHRSTKKDFERRVDKYFYEKENEELFPIFDILFWAGFIAFIAWGSKYYPRNLLYWNWFYYNKKRR